MKKLLYLPFLILLLLSACQKKEDKTPESTPENQLSMKVDGKLQVLPVSTSWLTPPDETILIIEAGSSTLNSGLYQMYIQSDISPGFHEYGASVQPVISFDFYKDNKTYDAYDGTFHILSNDPVARRIEFQFQIKLYNVNFPSDHYEITEGHVIANY
ncbi:MAG: hypothetical protein K0S23_3136 [Fluviicola sp.]|jgi:hypothetical protein|uniref:hypothetical protein n=1 Tax=Fluviicola sp. TaxID=1917219 RepID=UPI0026313C01|nr:hypothetical protein [Fluviicola sp.]MDF3028829.1 hypothetical protein [Fluviicola sp.]